MRLFIAPQYAKTARMIRKILSAVFITAFISGLLTVPALAQSEKSWREKIGTFRVGVVAAGRPVLETRRVQPFREALQKALGIPVEVFAAPDFNALIEAQRGGRIEYAVYSASAFSAAWLLCQCVTPIAAPTSADGSTGFRSVLIARKSVAQSLAGLRDATVLVSGEDSFAGSVFPRDQLAREGIDAASRGWDLKDLKTMDAVLEAFASGEGDALFGWQKTEQSESLSKGAAAQPDTLDRLSAASNDIGVIWKSAPVPYGPHAVSNRIPEEARDIIRSFLTGLTQDNPDAYEAIETRHTGGFQAVVFDDYRPVVDALRKPLLFSTPDTE